MSDSNREVISKMHEVACVNIKGNEKLIEAYNNLQEQLSQKDELISKLMECVGLIPSIAEACICDIDESCPACKLLKWRVTILKEVKKAIREKE